MRDARLFVERMRRDNRIIDPVATTILQPLDRIAVVGLRELLVARLDEHKLGILEVEDADL